MSDIHKRTNSEKVFSVYPSKRILFILLCGIILMLFLAVFLFTRPAFISVFDLTDKGTIGDAINGITGPIIALISAGLLFYSFQAQLEANKRQLEANAMLKSQWEFDTYYRLYGEIEKAYFENMKTTVTSRGVGGSSVKEYSGWSYLDYFREHIRNFLDLDDDNSIYFIEGHLNTIESILEDLIILINYVRDSNVSQKHFFLHRLERFYHNRLEEPLIGVYGELPKEVRFEKSHALNNRLIEIVKSVREIELKNDILVKK